MDSHKQRVASLKTEIQRFYDEKRGFRVYHGSTNSTRHQVFDRATSVDMSGFNHVLSIDTKHHIAVVEPNVPMDKLVETTLKQGYIPAVVMEFPGITVGGGIQGGAGESSSFRHGLFSDICLEYEFITPEGTIRHLSKDHNPELFYATAGSYGTFGVITSATIQLIPAKPYVHMTYHPVASYSNAVETLLKATKENHDFIDGIMFSPTSGVILTGKLSDEKLLHHVQFHRAHNEWFYIHVGNHQHQSRVESIPITDYLFRYDRGGFWVGRYAFERAGLPFNRFMRTVSARLMKTRKLYEALQLSGADQQYVVQDLALPADKAVNFMDFMEKRLGAFPLWLCPIRPNTVSPLLLTHSSTDMLINVGVWANKPFRAYKDFIAINRAIEREVTSLGGRKWFYAHSFYTETEFWKMFDKTWYDTIRKKYHAQYLPTLYDKIKSGPYRPVNIKKAALRTMFNVAKIKRK